MEITHVAHWGSYITTKNVSLTSATLDLTAQIRGAADQTVDVVTEVYTGDGVLVVKFPQASANLSSGTGNLTTSVTTDNPRLWGPPLMQMPHLYTAKTRLFINGNLDPIDTYETSFGFAT